VLNDKDKPSEEDTQSEHIELIIEK